MVEKLVHCYFVSNTPNNQWSEAAVFLAKFHLGSGFRKNQAALDNWPFSGSWLNLLIKLPFGD